MKADRDAEDELRRRLTLALALLRKRRKAPERARDGFGAQAAIECALEELIVEQIPTASEQIGAEGQRETRTP